MADTFAYKVRDRAGNVTTGTLVADSEALVLARLREQGFTPLDVKRQKRGIGQIEIGGEKVINDLYVAMIRAGETGGTLDATLLRLADMIEREVTLRGKIKSAMTYPVAVVCLVVLIMSAMLLFVVPQFKGIYGQLGGTLPLPTRALMGMSDAFKSFWYIVLA